MSLESLLEALKTESVTSVTSSNMPDVTKKPFTDQSCNVCNVCNVNIYQNPSKIEKPTAELWVIAFTPLGEALTVKARDTGHAEQIRRINPKPTGTLPAPASDPQPAAEYNTHAAMVRCCDCRHAKPTGHPALADCAKEQPAPGNCGPYRFWGLDFHQCGEFERTGQ